MKYNFIFHHEKEPGLKKSIPEAFFENGRYYFSYDVEADSVSEELRLASEKKILLDNLFYGWDTDSEFYAGEQACELKEAIKAYPGHGSLID